MSIRAMNWAMAARTGGVSAQCVLFVVADTANEHGVSVHADPDYIAERTRQSRATVFRRLKELETAGALTRLKRYRDDGAPVYEVRLHLDRDIDYQEPPADDGSPQDIEAESQIETRGESQSETGKVSPVRQAESQSCDSKSPSKNPDKIPPNPPSGGGPVAIDQDLESDISEFARAYPSPITNLPRLRLVLAAMERPERQRVLVAVKGYASFIAECERKNKPRAVKDADRWVASGMWQGYAAAGERLAEAEQMQRVPVESDIGRAVAALCRVASVGRPDIAGTVLLRRPLSAQGLAFVDAPPPEEWIFIPAEQTNQVKAWDDLLARELIGRNRPSLVHERNRGGARGFMAPWPWPPRKDGSLCTGPPES